MSTPLVYLILGPSGSGRRAVIADLVETGLGSEARAQLCVSTAEMPEPEGVRARLAAMGNLVRSAWHPAENVQQPQTFRVDLAPEATHVFVLSDGKGNPVDQVESFHGWLQSTGVQLARIVTVVNCQLGSAHPELMRWYDACVHFSDVVLLNRRDGVPNKWISDFTARIRRQHYPCLIEFVKGDEVPNPALVLEPQARRMSLLFDEDEEWAVATAEANVADDDDDEAAIGDDEDGVASGVDPYLERLASGRRVKEIPDIASYLKRT